MVDIENNCATIKPEGDITASTVEELRENIFLQLSEDKINITIDLKNVNIIDAIGLGVIISCHKALKELGGNLSFTGACNELLQLFKVLNLDRHFSVTSGP